MPVNPLVPFTDLVSGPLDENPFVVQPLSAQMWSKLNPAERASWLSELMTDSDGDDEDSDEDADSRPGAFVPDAQLDSSQVQVNPMLSQPAEAGTLLDRLKGVVTGKTPKGAPGQIPESVVVGGSGGLTPEQARKELGTQDAWEEFQQSGQAPLGIMDAQAGGGNNHAIPQYSPDADKWEYASDDPRRAEAIINVAESMLGKPYIWGGSSKAGADCSGLVQMAYRAAGIDMPRLAGFQMDAGKRVPINDLRPGDLVGYDWSNLMESVGGARGADHIGIYVGNGLMIEAARTGIPIRVTDLRGKDNSRMWGVRVPTERSTRDMTKPFNDSVNSLTRRLSSIFDDADAPVARNAASATVRAVNNIFDSPSKSKSSSGSKSSGSKKSTSKKPSGRTDINKGKSWEPRSDGGSKYSGSGATK